MAKVATVNTVCVGNDIGYGLYSLATLLLANGWTLQSCGTGTAGARRTGVGNELTQPEWVAAANTWQILYRGNVYVTFLRISATSLTVRYAVVAPATVSGTPATVPDAQVTVANQVEYAGLGIAASNRAHAITYSADSNAAGIRSFYLMFTDGSATIRGAVILEAMADGTYASGNPAPYVVGAKTQGSIFYSGNAWSWWYSPSSVWTLASAGYAATPLNYNANLFAGGATVCGVDPWDSKDIGVPYSWGRTTAQTQPGFVGQSSGMRAPCVFRSYPNTVDLATGAYVYMGDGSTSSGLVPWPDGITPL